jgi:hypothetical protein
VIETTASKVAVELTRRGIGPNDRAHSRGNDLDANPIKGEHLTNIRTTAKDERAPDAADSDEPRTGDRLYRR